MSRFRTLTGILPGAASQTFTGGVGAGTLWVNCGGKSGLTTIGAALKALQYSAGPATITVAGACKENV